LSSREGLEAGKVNDDRRKRYSGGCRRSRGRDSEDFGGGKKGEELPRIVPARAKQRGEKKMRKLQKAGVLSKPALGGGLGRARMGCRTPELKKKEQREQKVLLNH